MATFLTCLDKSIRRKIWKRESLPTLMMKLIDVGSDTLRGHEGNDCPNTPNGKTPFEKFFRSSNHMILKKKYEARIELKRG